VSASIGDRSMDLICLDNGNRTRSVILQFSSSPGENAALLA
jgi:hypothetical protein